MKIGDGLEPGAVTGPLTDTKEVKKVEAHIADAVKKGAKVVTGGKRLALGGTMGLTLIRVTQPLSRWLARTPISRWLRACRSARARANM
jgi:acyl-CoA reductase-like NAD-dependent aldehyde dehydrogenase